MNTHLENRAWAFSALDELEAFLTDEDFERNRDEERGTLHRKRRELKEGKYRVVFVGSFNVGKSTLINAILGDTYLPTVLEECTNKIIHVIHDEDMRTVLNLVEVVSENELRSLTELLHAYDTGAQVTLDDEHHAIVIRYAYASAACVRQSLDALTTMRADEDYPQMRSLRDKFDEVAVYVPAEGLVEDICLVDSPGTHSINETNARIAEEIIPHSHLVVCMLDSQNAGNEQNREFIERVVQHCRRKMFFVINKSDQLNPDEIDETGRRGPAKDLARCLEEVVANPEVFFLSSLYGLVSARLRNGHLKLEAVDADNKITIPYNKRRAMEDEADPARAVADYLLEESRLPRLKTRLFEYLYMENREGAVVESVCCFIDSLAWKFARPLDVKLEMARNVPRLDDIAREMAGATQELERRTRAAEEVMNAYKSASAGGEMGGKTYPGYEALVNSHLNRESIEKLFFAPLREWILRDDNFDSGQRSGFEALTKSLGHRLDAYLGKIESDVNKQIGAVEQHALNGVGEIAPEMDIAAQPEIKVERGEVGTVDIGLGASYAAFFVEGAAVGAALVAGAAAIMMSQPDLAPTVEGLLGRLPNLTPVLGEPLAVTTGSAAAVGGIAGALAGGLIGLIWRGVTAASARRKKLARRFCDRVDQLLLRGYRDGVGKEVPSVRERLLEAVDARRAAFGEEIKRNLDAVIREIYDQLGGLRHEEEALKKQQAETITRLEPKVARLKEVASTAKGIANMVHTAPGSPEQAAPEQPRAELNV